MLRNFLVIVRTYALSSLLNVIGLSLAFATALVIAVHIHYEYSYDKKVPDAQRVYRVELLSGNSFQTYFSMPTINTVLNSTTDIEAAVIYDKWQEQEISVRIGEGDPVFIEYYREASPELFTKILQPQIVDGSLEAINQPDVLMISQTTAKKLFGTAVGIAGKGVLVKDFNGMSQKQIGAVYCDFPKNSTFTNDIYAKFTDKAGNEKQWNNYFANFYVKLNEANNPASVEQQAAVAYSKLNRKDSLNIRLRPLQDIYFAQGVAFDTQNKGNRTLLQILIAIALLVVVMALINFINFTVALAPIREKSIQVHRIFGSTISEIRLTLISETVIFCAIASIFSLLIVFASTKFLSNLISADIFSSENYVIYAVMIALFLCLGGIAGLLSATYITRENSGRKVNMIAGKYIRQSLLVFQYTISVVLIIVMIFMNLQSHFISKKDLGFNYENILTFKISPDLYENNHNTLKSKLMESAAISDVAFCDVEFASSDDIGSLGRMYRNKNVEFNVMCVSYNFPSLIGLDVIMGRDLQPSDCATDKPYQITWLFNAKATAMYNIQASDSIAGGYIAGITNDYNYKSLRNEIEPLSMMCFGEGNEWSALINVYCKVVGDPQQARAAIMSAVNELDKGYPVEIKEFEESINKLYTTENSQTSLITIFSIVSIVISLMGIVSIILQQIKSRKKEIVIRKINGAQMINILTLLNSGFLYVILISTIIAIPLAYYGIDIWLTQFVYKTPVYWYVFAIGSLVVIALTVLTVTSCCWQIANAKATDKN